jgi:MFS family permease
VPWMRRRGETQLSSSAQKFCDSECAVPSNGGNVGIYPYAVLGVLIAASMLSFVDRTILGLLVDPLKQQFGFDEPEIGVLAGFGFVLFFSIMGLPFGRYADVGNRRMLIILGVAGWSLATAACGLAQGFTSLFFARTLVGIGEATLGPAAFSLLAGYFPRARLSIAMSLFGVGITLGNGVAVALGGVIVQWARSISTGYLFGLQDFTGWRLAFVTTGALGIPVVLMLLGVKEPARESEGREAKVPGLKEVVDYIMANGRAFAGVYVGYPLVVVMSFGQLIWGPTYFLRLHGYSAKEFGLIYGLVIGVGGSLALLMGGIWSDGLWRRGYLDAPMRIVLLSVVIQMPLLIAAFLCAQSTLALILFSTGVIVLCLNGGLLTSTIQILSPDRMRGRLSAIYLIFAYLVGSGLGPLFTGLMTKHLFGGSMGLGRSLATLAALTLPAAAIIIIFSLPAVRSTAGRLLRATSEPGQAF